VQVQCKVDSLRERDALDEASALFARAIKLNTGRWNQPTDEVARLNIAELTLDRGELTLAARLVADVHPTFTAASSYAAYVRSRVAAAFGILGRTNTNRGFEPRTRWGVSLQPAKGRATD
jgi:ATP/maltotriose-dependent transcriptional regulator MalT